MKIIMASTEFEGLLKTGGLGDAVTGICHSLSKFDDIEVDAIIPNYGNLDSSSFEKIGEISFDDSRFSKDLTSANILYKKINNTNVYLIDNDYYFNRENIYGYDDDLLRWAFICRFIYELIIQKDLNPDIVHTNDYHEGLVAYIFKNSNLNPLPKFVLTVHNAYFQGYYEFQSDEEKSLFEHYINSPWPEDNINLLKESVLKSDEVLTVSPHYAEGMKEEKWGNGLEDLYLEKGIKGFINGLDTSIHDREADNFEDYLNVKKEYKARIQEKFDLKIDEDIPLITYICRLGIQKGSDIVYESLNNFIDQSQFIVLGTGVEEFEDKFSNFKHENFHAIIDFDSELARELYIASDIFLMPSCFEPCGISQLIALHYSSIPIVTNIGGLKETVEDGVNGFKMKEYSSNELTDKILMATDIYINDKKRWMNLMKNAFDSDNSWDHSIKNYVSLYREMVKK